MNSQLYAHLEAYDVDGNNGDDNDDGDHGDNGDHDDDDDDDDDDDSGRCSSRSQLFANDTKRLSTTLDVIITIIKQRTNDKNSTKQVIAVVPIIGVALLYYYYYCDYCNEEFITSINNWYYTTTVLLFLTIFLTCWNKQNLIFPMRPINRPQKSQEISQEKQLLSPSLLPSPKRSNDDAVTVSELTTSFNHENRIEKVYDCRRELSRLLGLIGAPPMSLMQTNNTNTNNNNIDDSINITDVATMSVIDFLEAHVQFILSIDESLYWIKISASLHWGLGPHSQCVERVERAAIATSCQRRKRSRDRENNEDKNQLEPQRKLDTSSILALSSARQNLAKVIVHESQSIVEAITAIDSYIKQQQHCRQGKQQNKESMNTTNSDDSKHNHRTNKDDDQLHNDNGGDIIGYVVNNGLLVIPDVVDLVWIKSSRKHIANLLGICVDYLSTIDCLEVLSVEPLSKSPRSKLNESMWNARNLKEYICGNLLLDNSSKSSPPSISPMTSTSSSSTDHKFMMSLIQYRQQLDALNAVLLSCQQYNRHQSSSCSGGGGDTTINDNNPSSNHHHHHQEQEQEQDITNSVKISWWNQVKELSATCQTLEKEIENRFIPLNEHSQNTDSEKDCREVAPDSCQSLAKDHVLNESHNYEHTVKDELRSVPKHEQDQDRTTTTKTFVFSGKGLTKTKQKIVMDSGQMKNQVDAAAASLPPPPPPPPRDIITEQLLVRELQSRIRTVARLRDEEYVIVASRTDEYVDEYRESEDDEEHHTDEGNKDINSNGFIEDRPTVNGDDATVDTKREVTTDIFLGASGSLLAELKNNLSSNEFQIDEEFS